MKKGVLVICVWMLVTCIYTQQNLDNVIGQKECKVCHKNEFGVWEQTLHNKTYKDLSSNPLTTKIMKRLRLKGNPRKQESCRKCHYTLKPRGSIMRTIGAVACERCHGAAKDWINVHNNVKIPKPKRRKMASEAGMFHPGDIMGIANNCYSCHVVNDEKLVDVGRHPVGDANFKFVTQTQGKMRHNFISGNGVNIPAPKERKRLFYVVGQSLEIKYLLRALAQAKNSKNFFLLTQKQLKKAAQEMLSIHNGSKKEETAYIIKTLAAVKAVPNNKNELEDAAARIERAAQQLIKKYQVESWSFLDSLLPE